MIQNLKGLKTLKERFRMKRKMKKLRLKEKMNESATLDSTQTSLSSNKQ